MEEFRTVPSSSNGTVVTHHRSKSSLASFPLPSTSTSPPLLPSPTPSTAIINPNLPLTISSSPPDTSFSSDYSDPFVPEQLYESLKTNKRFDAMRRGHQEDAEEFLGFFLDTLHEEMLIMIDRDGKGKGKGKKGGKDIIIEEEDEWLEVGTKGRVATTRTVSLLYPYFVRHLF